MGTPATTGRNAGKLHPPSLAATETSCDQDGNGSAAETLRKLAEDAGAGEGQKEKVRKAVEYDGDDGCGHVALGQRKGGTIAIVLDDGSRIRFGDCESVE